MAKLLTTSNMAKKLNLLFAAGGAYVPTQDKKKTYLNIARSLLISAPYVIMAAALPLPNNLNVLKTSFCKTSKWWVLVPSMRNPTEARLTTKKENKCEVSSSRGDL